MRRGTAPEFLRANTSQAGASQARAKGAHAHARMLSAPASATTMLQAALWQRATGLYEQPTQSKATNNNNVVAGMRQVLADRGAYLLGVRHAVASKQARFAKIRDRNV